MHALNQSHQGRENVLLVVFRLGLFMCNKLHTIELNQLFLNILMILSLGKK